jgi:hypothetical protein
MVATGSLCWRSFQLSRSYLGAKNQAHLEKWSLRTRWGSGGRTSLSGALDAARPPMPHLFVCSFSSSWSENQKSRLLAEAALQRLRICKDPVHNAKDASWDGASLYMTWVPRSCDVSCVMLRRVTLACRPSNHRLSRSLVAEL